MSCGTSDISLKSPVPCPRTAPSNSTVLPTGTVSPTGGVLPTIAGVPTRTVSAARASHDHAWAASRRLCGLVRGAGAETGGPRSPGSYGAPCTNAPPDGCSGAKPPAPRTGAHSPRAASRDRRGFWRPGQAVSRSIDADPRSRRRAASCDERVSPRSNKGVNRQARTPHRHVQAHLPACA